MESDRRADFEELDREDCLALLRDEPVGRVALTARALPVVLPVNFALMEGDIVWRSAQGTKLNDASAGFVVAFEADHYDPERKLGWSVMIQGLAHVIEDAEELAVGEGAPSRVLGARRSRGPLRPPRPQCRDRHAHSPRLAADLRICRTAQVGELRGRS